ncbi:DNA repair and recombination protein RAD54B [Nephila pilipes]|uniref:DNA repair and recombination protein RAD54B n=1 Tax=Nephila pilipes TaxID=299642 RepID=A0A8X6NI17_NEPPI|nr:DNA repair and recombination protein RAD54B [Nephila pilipes]
MRRSDAPSLQSAAKRLRFLPPSKNFEHQIDKENELFNLWNSESDTAINSIPTNMSTSEEQKELFTNFKQNSNNSMHSKDKFLKLLLEPVTQELESDCIDLVKKSGSEVQIASNIDSSKDNGSGACVGIPKQAVIKDWDKHEKLTSSEAAHDSSNFEKELYYNVLWCKRSSKKHKVWEGDGILIIKNRSALLKDLDGKVIDRGIGYKMKEIESLEDGSKFYIGGKECEIQYFMSSEECKNFRLSERCVTEKDDSLKHSNLYIF